MATNSTVAATTPIDTSSTFSTSIPATDTVSTSSIPTSSSIVTTSSTSSSSDTSITSTSSTSSTTSSSVISTTSSSSQATIISISTASGANPSVVTVTSTESATPAPSNPAESTTASTTSSSASSSTSKPAALATSGAGSSSSGGLSSSGKIAIAVVVPIVAIAAIVAGLIFLWKRRKARKLAEEERRQEVEEYGYNPNNDPTLPAVGSNYGETHSEMQEDASGYRGWGTTIASTQRKPSTTLGSASNRGAVGMAVSDTTSNNGYSGQHSEGHSGDPLMTSPTNERPFTQDSEAIGALGGAPAVGNQSRDIKRGPSNASSAYTGHAKSEASEEGDRSPNGPYGSPNYYEDTAYYNEAQPSHGPYGDGSYGGGQPVIRDVQARRNTRIEKPSVFPQQGNAGISQNF